jgi:hypothetical protein
VLNKRGPLTTSEWRIIARHPIEGVALAAPLRHWLGEWLDTIEQHHERYDGTGYPHGLERRQISLGARVVAVTDSFETMTAVRSYNKPKSVLEARRELVRCAGSHFDPRVVRSFLNLSLGRLRWTLGVAAWIAELPVIGVPTRAGAELISTTAAFEPTANVGLAALVLTVAGVATPGLSTLGPGPGWAQTPRDRASTAAGAGQHQPALTDSSTGGGASRGADMSNAAGSQSSPSAASATPAPPGDPGANTPSPAGPAPDPSAGAPSSPPAGDAPQIRHPLNFLPPGLGGTPPGQTRITPGGDDVSPPGLGATPPGFTGIQP